MGLTPNLFLVFVDICRPLNDSTLFQSNDFNKDHDTCWYLHRILVVRLVRDINPVMPNRLGRDTALIIWIRTEFRPVSRVDFVLPVTNSIQEDPFFCDIWKHVLLN